MRSSLLRKAALGAALSAALTASARGQDTPGHLDREMVRSRDRGELHPGEPLRVVGMNEADADNDFRAGLRIARRGEHRPVEVDREEAYRRRLALFEDGARIDRASNVVAPLVDAPRRPSRERPGAPAEEEEPSTDWIGFALAGAAALALVIGAKRAT